MLQNRLKASVAACVVGGCAFAGGLLAKGVAPDRVVVAGLLIAVAGSAFASLVYFARMSAPVAELDAGATQR